ncbi:MAG TPA: hypothetical protein VIL85_24255 [Thermomicrobiales bacterium]|jgi:hypothetical protein
MKAPVALPFVKKGEDVPSSGVKAQAVLGFLLPFFLILLMGIIVFFMVSARLNHGGEPHALMMLAAL